MEPIYLSNTISVTDLALFYYIFMKLFLPPLPSMFPFSILRLTALSRYLLPPQRHAKPSPTTRTVVHSRLKSRPERHVARHSLRGTVPVGIRLERTFTLSVLV